MSELKLQQCRLDGRYDVLDCLGRGSYAEVYVAHDAAAAEGAPRTVVIKALNYFLQGVPDAELERTLIENFRNEAVALDRVRHPNIISRLGHGTAIDLQGRTFHYLVLEYLPGGDMQALCRRQPLSLEKALFYLEQVCDGLDHAHAHGVIHRDIKPQNLLLTADHQTLKIADFGVAKIEASEGGTITRVGTDVYAAPEHHPLAQTGPLDPSVLDHPKRTLTPAADVYSLAKTAYMLLTGEAPRRFSQKPIGELPEHVQQQPWASFVLRVLNHATQTIAANRYQTVGEFWSDLRDAALPKTRILTQQGGSEQTSTPATTPRKSFDKSKLAAPAPQPASFTHSLGIDAATAVADPRQPRPRIVVPVREHAPLERAARAEPPAREFVSDRPEARHSDSSTTDNKAARPGARFKPSSRVNRWLVAVLLISAFAGMLLATHNYVRGRRATGATTPARTAPDDPFASQIGSERATTTFVNMRRGPSSSTPVVRILDKGARVKVVNVKGRWFEVVVLENSSGGVSEQGWVSNNLLTER